MAKKVLMKNNEIIAETAIRYGIRYYFGYPITPQSEITEYMARWLPQEGGVFFQPESELAGINMASGCAGAGKLPILSTSGPGFSLMQECLSFMAAAELPCVIVDVMRAGPGDGDIAGAQGDYHQAVKCGGHGDYHVITIAPSSGESIVHDVKRAIELAKRYRMTVILLLDGLLAQMSEPVALPKPRDITRYGNDWVLTGAKGRARRVISSYTNDTDEAEALNLRLQKKYREVQAKEQRWTELETGDAEVILVAYGIVGRIAISAVKKARKAGLKVGLIQLSTLWPFPKKAFRHPPTHLKSLLVVEQSAGQMADDVRLAVNGAVPVECLAKLGGRVPTEEEIIKLAKKLLRRS